MKRANGGFIGPFRDVSATARLSLPGMWSLAEQQQYRGSGRWSMLTRTGVGLLGQTFSGDWRATISTGNIGSLPLSSPTVYTSISYGDLGDNYGFLGIGYFTPPTTGTYTFYTSSDDGSGVWVGDIASATSGRTTANAVVNNNMGGGQGDTKRSGTISLTAGVVYPIRIVHEEGAGGSNLTFSWAGPGISETTSLSTYFSFYKTEAGANFANYV